jgi:hypothetical protein
MNGEMFLVTIIALWIALSLLSAPVIGTLFLSKRRRDRHPNRVDLQVHEGKISGKEPPGPHNGGQGSE